jgi:molybdenum cofactor cytidylyltransferase
VSLGVGQPSVVILAAGGSTRMGHDKLLLDLGGVPMLQRTVNCYTKASKVGDVLVVVGPQQRPAWQWLSSMRVHILENPNPAKGMISSVRTALESSWVEGKDFLLTPADVPFVQPELIDKLVVDFRIRAAEILIPTYKGLGGHPGIYSGALQREFFMHGETSGAKEILMRHRDKTTRIAVFDPDICFDIDTEADAKIAMDPGARWAHVEAEVEARGASAKFD